MFYHWRSAYGREDAKDTGSVPFLWLRDHVDCRMAIHHRLLAPFVLEGSVRDRDLAVLHWGAFRSGCALSDPVRRFPRATDREDDAEAGRATDQSGKKRRSDACCVERITAASNAASGGTCPE